MCLRDLCEDGPPPASTMTLFEDLPVLCPTEPSVPYMLGLFCGFTAALWGIGWHAVHYQPCFLPPSRFQTHSWLSWSSSGGTLLYSHSSRAPLIALMRQGHQR